jgi:hypothetical protein
MADDPKDAVPIHWRLDWRDFQGRRVGQPKPPACHKRFKTEAAARRELARLRAVPGAVVVGFVCAVLGKPLVEQLDFGLPLGDGRRLTD